MSPRTPRDVSGKKLIKVLSKYGYDVTRQCGSHIRLTVITNDGPQNITVPNHDALKLGTLMSILNDVTSQIKVEKDEIIRKL